MVMRAIWRGWQKELRPFRRSHLNGCCVALFGLLALMFAVSEAQMIKIESPVRVSPPDSGGHFWAMGNTHSAPDDPHSLITCGIRIRTEPLSWDGYLYSSSDGGLTWRAARIDSTLTDDGDPDQVSETSCALGRHGTMYMNTSVYGKWRSNPFQLAHSSDGGFTWSAPLQRRGWYDATRSVVDNSGGSFDGRLYIFSTRFDVGADPRSNPCYPCYEPLLTSEDGGRSVQAAVTEKPGKQYRHAGWPSQVAVLNDGKVMAVHSVSFVDSADPARHVENAQTSNHWGIDVITSSDGGRSVDKPVTIRRWDRNSATADTSEPPGLFDRAPTLAVDRSSATHRGRVYVGWRELNNTDAIARIMLSWSDDSGKNWSKPIRVDDAPLDRVAESGAQGDRGTDPMSPAIAVNKDGAVGLLWMERFAMPSWRFSASLDGGATFLPSKPVYATHARDEAFRTGWLNNYATAQDHPSEIDSQGDRGIRPSHKPGFTLYTQFDQESALTATTDGVFHAMWITRDDGALWTTRIHVDGNTATEPGPSIDGLTDVSKRVRLEARNFHYDEASARMSVDVVLVNTSLWVPDRQPWMEARETFNLPASGSSGRPLQAPLILRVTSMYSDVGHVDLVNFDGVDSTGTPLVDWSEALPSGGLGPGARSTARRLEFDIRDLKPAASPDVFQVVNVSAEVYSK
jgi:hypothetical protein